MIPEDRWVEIVGAGNVSFEQAVLDEYSKDLSFVEARRPRCVVRPATNDEVKRIVDLANQTLTPLVPISSGSPHFRGDTVPGTGGSAIVDLRRMKKVMRIDRTNRAAMVEPGVTFGELIPEVEEAGLRLNVPLSPKTAKSVVASMLEREPVIMPRYQWDIGDPLCCVEVVYGTGDVFRTGSAAGPQSIEAQWAGGGAQKEAAGPLQASWFRLIQGAQGTMGIVTWASLRCEVLPQAEAPFLVCSSQLNKLLEMTHWLNRLRLVNECLLLNNAALAALLARKWPEDDMGIRETLPEWTLFFNIAGYEYFPRDRVGYLTKDVEDIARRIGLEPVEGIGPVSASRVLLAVRRPSDEPYWKLRPKGSCHDIFLLTMQDRLPELMTTMRVLLEESDFPPSDLGVYIQPIVQGSSYHCEFNLFYDSENPVEVKHIKELSERAVKVLLSHGAFFSRPYGEEARMIMERDANHTAVLKRIKAIFDPNNIMNTGKLCF
jgi:FAD/FMN-containing dehydrogenase